MNREAWLSQLVDRLRPWFAAQGLAYPVGTRISVGWPSAGGLGKSKRVVGQCWAATTSADGNPHIFISPLLPQTEALTTVVHELVHAAGYKGHGKAFAVANAKVGMAGKPTSSIEAGPELAAELERLATELGPYPHAVLTPTTKDKVQTTRLLKLTCMTHPEYILRASRKVIDLGLPGCGLCYREMQQDGQKQETEAA